MQEEKTAKQKLLLRRENMESKTFLIAHFYVNQFFQSLKFSFGGSQNLCRK